MQQITGFEAVMEFMTKQEFLDTLESRDRQYVKRGWISLALLVLSIAGICIIQHTEAHILTTKFLYGLVALFLFAGTIILLFWDMPRGVRCSSCHRRLFKTAAQITAATGNCAYCGERVFEMPIKQNQS
jgi:DNA-directed RNA polymerase subunit RPC12/RpoP